MMTLRRHEERGAADFGWLQSHHSFFFGRYYDADHMGFSDLRVINQDVVAPGAGFGTHPHENMEILTYVLDGALAHVDSMGNRRVLKAGEFQRMTAGTGVTHSEMNASDAAPVHFLQIWVEPDQTGLEPSYEELNINQLGEGLTLVAGGEGALKLHQDARIYAGKLASDAQRSLSLEPGRKAWVQMICGGLELNGQVLRPGDGLAIDGTAQLDMLSLEDAHFLVFDLR